MSGCTKCDDECISTASTTDHSLHDSHFHLSLSESHHVLRGVGVDLCLGLDEVASRDLLDDLRAELRLECAQHAAVLEPRVEALRHRLE
jgi:hypothetical protein